MSDSDSWQWLCDGFIHATALEGEMYQRITTVLQLSGPLQCQFIDVNAIVSNAAGDCFRIGLTGEGSSYCARIQGDHANHTAYMGRTIGAKVQLSRVLRLRSARAESSRHAKWYVYYVLM